MAELSCSAAIRYPLPAIRSPLTGAGFGSGLTSFTDLTRLPSISATSNMCCPATTRSLTRGSRPRLGRHDRHALGHVLAARAAGRLEAVIVRPENDEERLRELVAVGVAGILTDEPDQLRRSVGTRAGPLEEVDAPR